MEKSCCPGYGVVGQCCVVNSKMPVKAVKALLNYAFFDIDGKYSGLTKEEKTLVTEAEFNELIAWTKS